MRATVPWMWLLVGCAGSEGPSAVDDPARSTDPDDPTSDPTDDPTDDVTEDPTDAEPLHVWEVDFGEAWVLDVPDATHPQVAFGSGLDGRLVFDGGRPESTWAVELSPSGPQGRPWPYIPSVSGFSTPDLAWSGSGWVISARVAQQVALAVEEDGEPALLPLGDAAPLPFFAAPRVVSTDEGIGVVWWEARPASDPDGDAYWLSWRSPDGDVADPVPVARAGGLGSPVAATTGPSGWWLAYSEGQAVMVASVAGDQVGPATRVDQGGLAVPERPALAVDGSGAMAVGWRQQDAEQNGSGVRLRLWDPAGQPLTDELILGLDPDRANRIALACDGAVLVAAWDEGGGDDGDVALQFFDMVDGGPLTGPLVAHADRAGHQQRPAVALRAGVDGWTAHVVFEDDGWLTGVAVTLR